MINDLPIGRNVDEVMRLLEAIQFHEKNGEVCPAGWKKGALSMNADVHLSKKYFEAVHFNLEFVNSDRQTDRPG